MPPTTAPTPMLQQYLQIKAEHNDPNTILFFRLGDFYEMFYDDAKVAAKLLDITLTSRNRNDPNPVPLCGVPYHAAEGYIGRLIQAGKKVAICEQVEDPKTAKGVVKREVVRLVTPGAVLNPESLPAREHNFLAAVFAGSGRFGLAVIDISTGDFRVTELASQKALTDELERLEPRELLLPEGVEFSTLHATTVTHLPAEQFAADGVPKLEGQAEMAQQAPLAMPAAAAVWHYLKYIKVAGPELERHLQRLEWYQSADYLVIDEVTKRNLELVRTMADGTRHGSLLWLLDQSRTAMGARQLKQWLFYPLRDRATIEARQGAIANFLDNVAMQQSAGEALGAVADLERIAGRIITQLGNARDLIALRDSLRALPALSAALEPATGLLGEVHTAIDPCSDIVDQITTALVDDPPITLREGGLIRDGVDPELDELRTLQREGKGFIARLETEERKRTGISTLKVRYNKVFGYYIEVTNAHKAKVPEHYIRKQTLTNAERYITEELKQYEEKVITAQERLTTLEYDYFIKLREAVADEIGRIKHNAKQVALCDCLLALAEVAAEGNYCRPTLVDTPTLEIREGRHPVIERLLTEERFVPNDCAMGDGPRMLMITGPNMAGKSTVMRQVGIISLLAHMGSYVPAQEAVIGLTDRIFTRVGASDNLVKGQSTFMVEMAEAATILREATAQSLIIIDELGRGTSTFDGISIAWAVAEYLHDTVQARTLFATHYHELAALADSKAHIGNVTMAVKEWNDQIVFLRKLIPGAANRSYGIQVAKLAGLPAQVVTRAHGVLADLESEGLRVEHSGAASQMSLFQQVDPIAQELKTRLAALDLNNMTPLEALHELHNMVEQWKT